MIQIAGPLDICKTQILLSNQRTYALMICVIGAVNQFFVANLIDPNLEFILNNSFAVNRGIIIFINVICIVLMIKPVSQEVPEILLMFFWRKDKNKHHATVGDYSESSFGGKKNQASLNINNDYLNA